MKKFFVLIAFAAALVSCGNDGRREFYFDEGEQRVYNDPAAQLDTLSYAVGMNIGLGMVLHPAGNIFDIDVIISAFNEEIAKSEVDKEFLAANAEYLKNFSNDRLRKYVFARRMAGFKKDAADLPDLPELFDDVEYTAEKVSQCYGYDMANHVRKMCYPLNLHWFMAAMEDAKTVESDSAVDDFMAISTLDFRKVMTDYNTQQYPMYMVERSAKWLEHVAQQKDVHALTVDDNTLYYRVDVAGNGVKPRSLRDTVAFSYDVYTQRGELVESLDKRIATLQEALASAEADTTATNPEQRAMRLSRIKMQLSELQNLNVVLERAMIKGSQYGMQKVGEGGEITMWIPASLAYGDRGNKVVSPNEGIVMTVRLMSVAYGPTAEEIEAEEVMNNLKKMPKKPAVTDNIARPGTTKAPHQSDDATKVKPVLMKKPAKTAK